MSLIIPERTIDSLFTFELISAAPTAIVVSPQNNKGPRTPDHEVQGAVRKFVFECKTIYTSKSKPGGWVLHVPRQQLADYVSHGGSSIVYVLPAEPTQRKAPWIRDCRTDPDHGGRCRACSNPTKNYGAIYQRRWAGNTQPVASAPDETRMQPWFNHWAWCVRADDLQRHIRLPSKVTGVLGGRSTAKVPADDTRLEAIVGALRLCHFLGAVEQDFDTIHGLSRSVDGGPEWSGGQLPDEAQGAIERMSTRSLVDLPRVEDDRRLVVGY